MNGNEPTPDERRAFVDGAAPCPECHAMPCGDDGAPCRLCAAVIRAAEDDHLAALVRHDIAAVARTARLRCVAAIVEASPDAAQWEMVRDDLRAVWSLIGGGALRATAWAANAMSRGDVCAAALELAEFHGLTVEMWAEETRKEMRR